MKNLPEFGFPALIDEFGNVSLLRKKQVHEIVMRPDGSFQYTGKLIDDCNKEKEGKEDEESLRSKNA